MSLDVYLYGPEETIECVCDTCEHRHSRVVSPCLYSANITHNLGRMAAEAGVYGACWRPDEHGITTAAQVAEVLRPGIALLLSDPDGFAAFDAPNGWGRYFNFVPWLERYLAACDEHPTARVEVSR